MRTQAVVIPIYEEEEANYLSTLTKRSSTCSGGTQVWAAHYAAGVKRQSVEEIGVRYWLTTHWPPREDEPRDGGSGIWLPDGREGPGALISVGDLVFVYESRSGRTEVRRRTDGSVTHVRCQSGREGIVHIGRVRDPLTADSDSEPESYVDGTTIWWRWYAPVDVMSRSGFVPRADVAEALGYKRSYNFHGFGHQHSGLREVSQLEFERLLDLFTGGRPIPTKIGQIPRGGHSPGGTGESSAHRDLKLLVADDPASLLGEMGLTTVSVEYPFATGDRADIVLTDQYGRIIGVEIEPSVTFKDVAGPLQAIKYRRMLEWTTDRVPGDSRSFLVAYSISDAMKERCRSYSIECYEVSEATVREWRRKQ